MKSKNDIPKFDLTEQIMVEQRKTASVKRKAPNKNRDNNRDSIPIPAPLHQPASIPKPISTPNPCDQIIVEIVARDIKKFRSH